MSLPPNRNNKWRNALNRKPFRWADIYRSCWIAGDPDSSTTINKRINEEIKKGNIRRVGRGQYQLLWKFG